MFKNILVPVDGSEHSKKSLLYAKEIAESFGSCITILHVYELPIQIAGYEYSDEISESIIKDLGKNAQNILDRSEKQIENPQLKIKKVLLIGNQGAQVIDYSEKEDFDLIVMGSKGLSNIKSFLIGSVSNYVIHHTNIPILLIN